MERDIEIPQGEILERLWVTSDKLYLIATSKKERLFGKPIGADLISIGGLKEEIRKELDKAREEGFIKGVKECTEKSTPEQKEEGGCKGFWSYYRNRGDDRELAYLIVDGEKFLSEESVKNLLSEREMFTKDELFMLKLALNDIFNGGNRAYEDISNKIKSQLSKLTTK